MTPNTSTTGGVPPGHVRELIRAWEDYQKNPASAYKIEDCIRKLRVTLVGPTADLAWKQYELLVGNYERLLELTLKVNALYYVATGYLVDFCRRQNPAADRLLSIYPLLFPIMVSLVLIPLCGFGAILIKDYRKQMRNLTKKLSLEKPPEFNVLAALLASSALLFLVVASALLGIYFGYGFWLGALLIEAVVCVFFGFLFRNPKEEDS